ncbi:ATP-binding protein [Qipengyuania sp. 6B39]|uniref:ATP-binding protein n=1 Tax=Qipengyuania proteolytica TaxID=2867239 RepID=UPI001C8A08C1|nr:ATP-binding protein [Qipengyuania proteolytica]MBX7496459.1 ATP-binding protein [Qipengyuania proteolytica]
MANRGLTDSEIALVKGMLARGMPAQEICGFLFRPNRSLNPAGVYEIRSGQIGGQIPAASAADTQHYLENHPYFGEMAVADRIAELRKELRGILNFRKDGDNWVADPKESARLEFKETFHLKSLADYSRSLVGYANNSGGFIVFGIADDQRILGLQNDHFRKLDSKKFSEFLKDTVNPSIPWGSFQFTFRGFELACLFAHESEEKPHMTLKNAGSMKANQTYYRYEGETAVIRAGELSAIIRRRENDAVQHAISKLQQIAGLGIRAAEVSVPSENPDAVIVEREVVRKSTISDRDILADFINANLNASPSDYIEQSAHEIVRWLPIYYYMNEGGLAKRDVEELLKVSKIAKPGGSKHILDRVSGKASAYKQYVGRGERECLKELRSGKIPKESDLKKARHLSGCLMCLESKENFDGPFLKAVLNQSLHDFEAHGQDPVIGSNMRRSAARVDELIHGETVKE